LCGGSAILLWITTPHNFTYFHAAPLSRLATIVEATVPTDTQAQEQLLRHRRTWEQKSVLRRVYQEQFFARLLQHRNEKGPSVEVGAGPGFFKQFAPAVFSTDLIPCPWLDIAADAQHLPFRSGSVANVFGLDMLHHLAAPLDFLREAARVLIPGGRLILIEPWITPFSWLLFRFFHQERCDLSETPWLARDQGSSAEKLAFDGNQAIPYLLFGPRRCSETLRSLPDFQVVDLERFCLFTYLLSGGFNHASLLPAFLYSALAKFERITSPLWRPLAALRVLLVLEKAAPCWSGAKDS
jgi:SAM-dependent methyltransferase